MQRYYPLAAHFRRRFGRRVQKIPLDAGSDCPNRDGSISTTGCVFCNPRGSGTGLWERGMGLAEQWDFWRVQFTRKYRADLFMAYLQSFSNTHGPVERLAGLLEQLRGLPGLAGLAVGTRPDCLDADKLALLAAQPVDETWLELGLQSAHDDTLARIGRGHDFASFARAAEQAAEAGLLVCAHVVAGLPGEGKERLLGTIQALNRLPVHGVKFHNLYVCRGSRLAGWWERGEYQPLEREAYVDMVAAALTALRPGVVVQRLTGDAAQGELLAPDWAADKAGLLADIHARLEALDTWQGKDLDPTSGIPEWFSPQPHPLEAS